MRMRLFDDDDDDLDDGHISMLWWPLLSDKDEMKTISPLQIGPREIPMQCHDDMP